MLPALTTIELLDLEGNRYTNRVEYGSCRQFQAESVFRTDLDGLAGEPPVAKESLVIPAGVELRIALRTILDSHSTFAGDAIEGVLMTPIQMRHLGPVIVPGGAIVHGVVVRFEEKFRPRHN